MRTTIDLHGLSHEESLIKVEEFLLLNSFDNYLDLELITGKSDVLQKKIINNILKKYDFQYFTPNYNTGVILVSNKKLN